MSQQNSDLFYEAAQKVIDVTAPSMRDGFWIETDAGRVFIAPSESEPFIALVKAAMDARLKFYDRHKKGGVK